MVLTRFYIDIYLSLGNLKIFLFIPLSIDIPLLIKKGQCM